MTEQSETEVVEPEEVVAQEADSAETAETAQVAPVEDRTPASIDFVSDVPLEVTVEVGGTRLLVRDVLALHKGSVVELDRLAGEPADVLVNGKLIGRGEVAVVDDRLSVRLVEISGASPVARVKS